MTTRFRGDPAAVASARAFVRHALRSVSSSLDVAERIELATAEACNNAILHASGSAFTVSVTAADGQVTVTVSDDGEGFEPPTSLSMPPPQAIGRRGLPLMRALVDGVDVSSNVHGTRVVLTQGLTVDGSPSRVGADS